MRKRVAIVVVAIAGALLAIVAASLYAGPEPKLGNWLSPEDLPQIQRAVGRARWKMTKTSLEQRELKMALMVCIPELLLGRVRDIDGVRTSRPARAAVARSSGWYSRKPVSYLLEQTTNGWQVIGFYAHANGF